MINPEKGPKIEKIELKKEEEMKGKKQEKEKELKQPEWLKEVEEKVAKDDGLYQGIEKISELPDSEKLITKEELEELSKKSLQKRFEEDLAGAYTDGAKEIEEYAKEKGIELEISKEALQKGFEKDLAGGRTGGAKEIEEYAKEKGIELEISKEALQKRFEKDLAGGRTDDAKEIEEYAKEKGIELILLKGMRDTSEESYIRVIHNLEIAHSEHIRNELLKTAKEKGIELDYNKIVKMDYLDLFNVPKKDRLEKEKEVKLGDVNFKSTFYGQIKENKCEGKFILAKNPKTKETNFIFDATLAEHNDIGNKYGLVVIGGGWLKIDNENKKIVIEWKSQDFGYEPRVISATIVAKNFPKYEIEVEK